MKNHWLTMILGVLIGVILTACGSQGGSQSAESLIKPSADAPRISPQDYASYMRNTPHLLVDVRSPQEFAQGAIEGAVNIPLLELPTRLAELPRDTPLVLYCSNGNRARSAVNFLAQQGYTQLLDLVSVEVWQAASYELTQAIQ